MGDSIGVLMSVLFTMAVFGRIGYKIAEKQTRNPYYGAALGALIPVAGVGILLLLGPKTRKYGG
jgi:hypothetical protein